MGVEFNYGSISSQKQETGQSLMCARYAIFHGIEELVAHILWLHKRFPLNVCMVLCFGFIKLQILRWLRIHMWLLALTVLQFVQWKGGTTNIIHHVSSINVRISVYVSTCLTGGFTSPCCFKLSLMLVEESLPTYVDISLNFHQKRGRQIY